MFIDVFLLSPKITESDSGAVGGGVGVQCVPPDVLESSLCLAGVYLFMIFNGADVLESSLSCGGYL